MSIFNLPDLGEGLPDAEIHEWFVKEGDQVKIDQPLVAVETAKAVVDVPCPYEGVVLKLFGKPGDIIKTGEPLVSFQTEEVSRKSDAGTVVGQLEEGHHAYDDPILELTQAPQRIKATPRVKAFAKKNNVALNEILGTGEHGYITQEDVEKAISQLASPPQMGEGYAPLRGVKRAMVASMTASHKEVVPVSIFEEADISAWGPSVDITVRLIQALIQACKEEPALNAWYDSQNKAIRAFDTVHLGLAMDTEDGLFVPVIQEADKKTPEALREIIERYKKEVTQRQIPSKDLKGASITLSNFGKFSGLFANPIIVPPSVAILAVGRKFERVVCHQGKFESHPFLPLSLSFDHRAVTGGEATRFLGVIKQSLKSN